MSLPCPVCGAANDAGPACRRCRADLSLCFAVEAQRDRALAAARSAAAQGRLAEAFRRLARAAALRRGEDVTRLRAVLALLAGDYARAWGLYRPPGTSAP
jgi:hypothetical protein